MLELLFFLGSGVKLLLIKVVMVVVLEICIIFESFFRKSEIELRMEEVCGVVIGLEKFSFGLFVWKMVD